MPCNSGRGKTFAPDMQANSAEIPAPFDLLFDLGSQVRHLPYQGKIQSPEWDLKSLLFLEERKMLFTCSGRVFLTFLGSRVSKKIKEVLEVMAEQGPSTRDWMRENYQVLVDAALKKLRAKMPMTHAVGLGEDVVHDMVERLLRRRSMDEKLQAGKKVYPSTLAGWAVRQGITDARNRAGDPGQRALYGALRPAERQALAKGQSLAKTQHVSDPNILEARFGRQGEDESVADAYDMDRIGVRDTTERDLCLEQALTRVDVILRERLRVPEGDLGFLRKLMFSTYVLQQSVDEIAASLGMEGAGRQAVREGQKTVEQAFKMFQQEQRDEAEDLGDDDLLGLGYGLVNG